MLGNTPAAQPTTPTEPSPETTAPAPVNAQPIAQTPTTETPGSPTAPVSPEATQPGSTPLGQNGSTPTNPAEQPAPTQQPVASTPGQQTAQQPTGSPANPPTNTNFEDVVANTAPPPKPETPSANTTATGGNTNANTGTAANPSTDNGIPRVLQDAIAAATGQPSANLGEPVSNNTPATPKPVVPTPVANNPAPTEPPPATVATTQLVTPQQPAPVAPPTQQPTAPPPAAEAPAANAPGNATTVASPTPTVVAVAAQTEAAPQANPAAVQQNLTLRQVQLPNPNVGALTQQPGTQATDEAGVANNVVQAEELARPGFTPRTFIAPSTTAANGNAFALSTQLANNPLFSARAAERLVSSGVVPVASSGRTTTAFGVPADSFDNETLVASSGLLGLGLDEAPTTSSGNASPFASTVNPFSGNNNFRTGSSISPASLAFSSNNRSIAPFGQPLTPVALGAPAPVRGLAPGQVVVDPTLDPTLEDPAVAAATGGTPAARRRVVTGNAEEALPAEQHAVVPGSVEEPAARARYQRTVQAAASTETANQILAASGKTVSTQALAQSASIQLTVKIPTHLLVQRNVMPTQAQQMEVQHRGNTTSHGQQQHRPRTAEEIMAEYEEAKRRREEVARIARDNFNQNMISNIFSQAQVANQQLAAFAV